MAGGVGRRRLVLLFSVLAGLFLMHGLDAPAMHGMPVPMSMSRSVPMPTSMSVPRSVSAPVAVPSQPDSVVHLDAMSDHMQADTACVPLRPEGMSGLFLALFLIVTMLWRPRLPHLARPIRPRWPHGPPRTGIEVLRTLNISRT
jgi:hypothetical protein